MPSVPTVSDQAWVTLATNDTYALGALVLAHSLSRARTSRALVVMVAPQVSPGIREVLAEVYNEVKEVDVLDSRDEANLALIQRPELGVTFTKLHCWRLGNYNKCVFLDADTLVMQNCDELFEHEELSAAPDCGWPDCFNSGVFVFCPNEQTYQDLLNFALSYGSFDGGDQGLLNLFFHEWARKDIKNHLPFVYNMVSTAAYSYLPAVKQFAKDVKIVHFLGSTKPWMHNFDPVAGQVTVKDAVESFSQGFLQTWWDIFASDVLPRMSAGEHADLTHALGRLNLQSSSEVCSDEASADVKTEQERYAAWEKGQMDYMGTDSFANIQAKLDAAISTPKRAKSKSPEAEPEPDVEETT
ncbi:unnamed protein product [Notodromas monacha]|uniref:glycogenin glucosyltransferase n=1 Tax=Notodromas monacha TaxID=399045 RepID=A0A7R9GGR4_9CRUS|nr:unnamed protein product [Notodromas monacha]CAG0922128.1 unnamed protein product [Notodromas monacha]